MARCRFCSTRVIYGSCCYGCARALRHGERLRPSLTHRVISRALRSRVEAALLMHPNWSDSRLSALVATSQSHVVALIRRDLERAGLIPPTPRRIGLDGRELAQRRTVDSR